MSNSVKIPETSKSVIFFGSRCEFSRRAVSALRDSGLNVRAVVLPAPPGRSSPIRRSNWSAVNDLRPLRPEMSPHSTSSSPEPDVPVFEVARLSDAETIDALRSLDAALFALVCFPRRLPAPVIELPRLGALNVHPSLLPGNRGPDPLFWTYRCADPTTGVTVHFVDRGLDSGPIVDQRAITVPPGIPGNFLWDRLASLSAETLVDCVKRALTGSLSGVEQDERTATYRSWPTADDLVIPIEEWDASRVYHFCVGVMPFGYRPRMRLNARMFEVVEIHGTSNDDEPHERSAEGIAVRCRRGIVRVSLRELC